MADDAARPIIKKVKKGGGHGHHGGAWKVAYADFVTAMMAFFLLMWLLNATSEDQKKGLADYFLDKIPITQMSAGGEDVFNGDSMVADGESADNGAGFGGEEDLPPPTDEQAALGDLGPGQDAQAMELLEEAFQSFTGESDVADTMLRHIRTRVTEDGLVIDVFDVDGAPLFSPDSAEPTAVMRELMAMIGSVSRLVTNAVAIAGHTGSTPFDVGGDDTAWQLSSDRAQAARRLLNQGGVQPERVARVTGHAATQPLVDDRDDPRNRRISVILLR